MMRPAASRPPAAGAFAQTGTTLAWGRQIIRLDDCLGGVIPFAMRPADLDRENLKEVHASIYRYLRSIGVSNEDAEVFAQEIIFKHFNKHILSRKNLSAFLSLIAFLCTAAKHLYIDKFRREE